MTSVYAAIVRCALRTGVFLSEMRWRFVAADAPRPHPDLIYKLKRWPELPSEYKKADVYQILSVMSNQPVNRSWLVSHWHAPVSRLDKLLEHLIAQGEVQTMDTSGFRAVQ